MAYFVKKRQRNREDICEFSDSLDHQEIVVMDGARDSKQTLQKMVDHIQELKVLGLDCEWITHENQARPVALLQLATPKGLCVLFHLCKFKSVRTDLPELTHILMDRSILKVGVGVLDDAKKLAKDYGLITKGCVDLRHLALRHLPKRTNVTSGSLAELAKICVAYDMEKSWNIRCSNWEASELTDEQVKYAAVDACVAIAIFFQLLKPKLPAGPENEEVIWGNITALCQGVVDVKFKAKLFPRIGIEKVNCTKVKKKKEVESLDELHGKNLSRVYSARKEPLYDNCKLVAPNGTLLTTCDRRKAEWYVKKDIGEVISENPLVVRLKFEPAGVPGPDREYYLQDKANVCVVCGRTDSYIRKNIVPHEYRRHFPDYLKQHSSHDILLLCIDCHQCSWTYDSILRQEIAEEYDAPISNVENTPTKDDPVKVKVRSAARALFKHQSKNNIPENRVKELQKVIEEYFQVSLVDNEILENALKMDTRVTNEKFEMFHGEKVVKSLSLNENGYAEFEKRWRVHFLNKMQPKYLPKLWSVDHKHESQTAKKE